MRIFDANFFLAEKTRFDGIDIDMWVAVLEPTRGASGPRTQARRGTCAKKRVRRGTAATHARHYQQTRPTSYTRRRSSPGTRTQHPTVRARPLEDSGARACDTCTDRSRTRRHFSGGGRVQREGARGRLCAAFLLRPASLLCCFSHSPILGGNLSQGVQKTLGSSLEQRPGGRGYMKVSL